jgi:hypothetical protein
MVKPLDRLDARTRQIIEERRSTGYHKDSLANFEDLKNVLSSLIERLLPGVPQDIDLVAFVDEFAVKSLGRGDRRPGVPPDLELFRKGLLALQDRRFEQSSPEDKDKLIARMRRGQADNDLGLPAREFIDRLLNKALAGYLAHPDVWERIGFNGPAYPEGYAWIGRAEVQARHKKARGAEYL